MKLKMAFEILSQPEKRVLYDVYGQTDFSMDDRMRQMVEQKFPKDKKQQEMQLNAFKSAQSNMKVFGDVGPTRKRRRRGRTPTSQITARGRTSSSTSWRNCRSSHRRSRRPNSRRCTTESSRLRARTCSASLRTEKSTSKASRKDGPSLAS